MTVILLFNVFYKLDVTTHGYIVQRDPEYVFLYLQLYSPAQFYPARTYGRHEITDGNQLRLT